MKFKVHMLAFEETYRIREVEIPDSEKPQFMDETQLLETIFYNGQNEIQSQTCCSVSVGDVIEIGDTFHMVMNSDFLEINVHQLLGYIREDRLARTLYSSSKERFLGKFPA